MEGKTKIILAVVVALIVIGAAVGAVFAFSNNNNNSNTLVIASSPDFVPYDYMVGQDWTGIDMDICRAVCKEIGYNIEFKNVQFDSIIAGVTSGKYSMGASGFSITEERKESVLFSDSYATVRNVLLVPKSSTIASVDDAKKVPCGAQNGTTGHTLAINQGFGANIISYNTYSDVFQNLKQGNIQCAILDSDTATGFLNSDNNKNNYKVVEGVSMGADEYYAFVFKKSDTALCEKFNGGLKTIKDNGTLQKIVDWYATHGFANDTPSYWIDHKL